MKINILLCDTFPGLLPPSIPTYVSMFTNLFDRLSDNLEYEVFPVYQGKVPVLLKREELYLITGSNAGAYENEPWIQILLDWIRQANEKTIKLVGICFGHQAIAQALGGKVERAVQGWGIGVRTSNLIDEEALLYFPNGKLSLLYNHHDQVVCLPSNAKRVAISDFCTNESFRIGNHILTFQGHPEYTSEYEKHLIMNHAKEESNEIKGLALQSLKQAEHQGAIVAKWILDFSFKKI